MKNDDSEMITPVQLFCAMAITLIIHLSFEPNFPVKISVGLSLLTLSTLGSTYVYFIADTWSQYKRGEIDLFKDEEFDIVGRIEVVKLEDDPVEQTGMFDTYYYFDNTQGYDIEDFIGIVKFTTKEELIPKEKVVSTEDHYEVIVITDETAIIKVTKAYPGLGGKSC